MLMYLHTVYVYIHIYTYIHISFIIYIIYKYIYMVRTFKYVEGGPDREAPEVV